MSDPILALCTVEAEAAPLLEHLTETAALELGGLDAWSGLIGDRSVWCVAGGMGKVNAAHAATVALRTRQFAAMIGFGIGGAYPGAGLAPGDIAIATVEEYGDEGSLTPDGWISCEGIGIPLVRRDDQAFFNRFPVVPALVDLAASAAGDHAAVRTGPFLTLSCCSGTDQAAREMERRFGAICETMEGAAYAHIAALQGVPFVEIRGISNIVENRNPAAWNIPAAARAAAAAVAGTIAAWTD